MRSSQGAPVLLGQPAQRSAPLARPLVGRSGGRVADDLGQKRRSAAAMVKAPGMSERISNELRRGGKAAIIPRPRFKDRAVRIAGAGGAGQPRRSSDRPDGPARGRRFMSACGVLGAWISLFRH